MRVLVVDDEALARERLKRLLEELPGYECCGEAGDGVLVLRLIEARQPDVVLLDVRMPGMDGLETARHLCRLATPPAVIFTTAYGEYALDAFRANSAGYLLKPIRKEHLAQALHNAATPNRAQLACLAVADGQMARTHICARLHGDLRLVPVEEVVYFRADQKYVTLRHRHGEILIDDSLRTLETEFAPRFLRIHRNALVARECLRGLSKVPDGRFEVALEGIDDRLEVSRRHLAAARRWLKSR